jgi:glycerate 2-kinase
MAAAASEFLRTQIRAGLVIASTPVNAPPPLEVIVAGHPVPNAASEDAGRRALSLAESTEPAEQLLVLLSGGASSLMAAPARGVSLDDKRATTDRLLREGADIHALNTVRKHLSAIKGGRLAALARGECRALVISDVVGDDPGVIASGPTTGDATTMQDALEVIRRFGGERAFPAAVVERLRTSTDETPKPGDSRLARTTTTIIGSRRDAMIGAAAEAMSRGYHVVRIDDPVTGEARRAAPAHLQASLALAADAGRPVCVVSSGETTVRVTGRGKGGRNQEFALAAAARLAHLPAPAAVASVGTDGIDGPTDAAGGIVDETTLDRARTAGLAPEQFLSDNNAYAFFDALGDLIHLGPTGTNVGDLQIILLA